MNHLGHLFSVASLSAAFLALAACGGSSSDNATPAAGSDLNGTWASTCVGPVNGMYSVTTITYDDLALTGNYSEYSDAACASKVHSTDWTGTSTIAGKTATGETKIDIAYASFKSTPLTAANAGQNNAYKYCESTDWAAGTTKDILGKTCQGFSIPVGGKSLDIYKVSGTTLTFGKDAKIAVTLAESDRPTTLQAYGLTKK